MSSNPDDLASESGAGSSSALTGEIYAVVQRNDLGARISLVFAGGARRLVISTTDPVDLSDLWHQLLEYFGISLSTAGPWGKIFDKVGVTPAIKLSSATGTDGNSLAVSAGLEFSNEHDFKYPEIGGTWTQGPLELSFEPHIQVRALFLSYDPDNGVSFSARVLFLDPEKPAQSHIAAKDEPTEPTPQIVKFPFPLPPEKKAANPAFELRYLGLGQRFGPEFDINAPDPMAAALTALEEQLTATDPQRILTDLVQHYYHPDRNWYVGIDLLLRGFRIRVIFNDPVIYGLEITGYDEPLKGLKFEIVYQKLGPHLGVYFGSLTIPDKYRTFNIGAGSLTIPSFSIWIYTNGDFKVSVGWPLGKDSLVIQFYIFIGGGGFYFAKLRSADVPGENGASPNYNPVIEFGLAVFLGVGRSITSGPLSAELSLTMQGTFQGVLAWKALDDGKASSISRAPDNYWFAASVGLVGVLEGSVDLKVINVAVSIRISVTVGVAFQLGYQTPVVVNAAVSVRASVKLLFFTVHLKFHMDFTHTFILGSGAEPASLAGPLGDLAAFQPPSAGLLRHRLGRVRDDSPTSATLEVDGRVSGRYVALADDPGTDLALTFVVQPTVVYDDAGVGKIAGVAQLFMDAPAPTGNSDPSADDTSSFEKLLYAFESGLLDRWKTWGEVQQQLGQGHDEAPTGFDDLVEECFDRFTVTVNGFDGSSLTGQEADRSVAVFPMWPSLMLHDPQTDTTTHFSPPSAPPVPADYDKVLVEYYRKLSDFDLSNHGRPRPQGDPALFNLAPGPESLAQKIFLDYFLLLGRQIAADMVAEADRKITLRDHAANPADLAGRMAAIGSRFLLHGQRLPDPAHVPRNPNDVDLAKLPLAGLYSLTGQQVEPSASAATPYDLVLELDPSARPPSHPIVWGPTPDAKSVSSTLPGGTAPSAPDASPEARAMPALDSHPLWYAVRNREPWADGDEQRSVVPLPQPLMNLAADLGDVTVTVSDAAPSLAGRSEERKIVATGLVVRIKLQRVKHAATTVVDRDGVTQEFVPDVYQLVGADDETRELIGRFLVSSPESGATTTLAYSSGSGLVTADGPVVLAKVSLSTTSQPDSIATPMELLALQLRAEHSGRADPLGPTSATLASPDRFLRLVWEASVTNGPGFLLHVPKIPQDAFGDTGQVDAEVIVELGKDPSGLQLSTYTNALLIADSTPPFINVTNHHQYLPSLPAGAVGITFTTRASDPTNDPYARGTIASLYSLYEAQIQATPAKDPDLPALTESLWSQPFGPTTEDTNDSDDDGEHRDNYEYAVPVFGFVSNPMPPPNPLLAPLRWHTAIGNDDKTRNNRYAAIGAIVPITLVPLDVFGNRLESAAATPRLPVEYHDPIIPIDEWPGFHLSYSFDASAHTGSQPSMQLTATFSFADVLGADQVVIAAPSGGTRVNTESITVAGTVRNTADTVEVVVSRSTIGGDRTPPTAQPASVHPDGTWSVDGVRLGEGDNLVTVTATSPSHETVSASAPVTYDPNGGEAPPPTVTAGDTFLDRIQTAIARYSVIIDQLADPHSTLELYTSLVAPAVALTQPVDGSAVAPGVMTVHGIVQDLSSAVTVQVGDGQPINAAVAPDGTFVASNLVAPDHGAITLTTTATPAEGAASTSVITVYCGTSDCPPSARSVPGASAMIADGTVLSDPLHAFVGDLRSYLESEATRYAGRTRGANAPPLEGTPPSPVSIALPVDTTTLTTRIDDIFPITAHLRIKRLAHVNPDSAVDLPDAAATASQLSPDFSQTGGGSAVALHGWATRFEQAFARFDGKDGVLKLASRPRPGNDGSEDRSLWAIRWGTDSGIHLTVPNEVEATPLDPGAPIYFASPPLNRSLMGGTVEVPRYDDNVVQSCHAQTYSQIDLDVWAREFLTTVDSLLSPAWAVAGASLRPDLYDQLMAYKASLAQSIAASLTWTLTDQLGAGDRDSAIDRLEQELLTSLDRDYTTSAVVQVPVDVTVSGVSEQNSAIAPRFFGSVRPPALTITSPSAGETVSGQLTVAGFTDHRVSVFRVTVGNNGPVEVAPSEDGCAFQQVVEVGATPTRIDVDAVLRDVVVATKSVTVNTDSHNAGPTGSRHTAASKTDRPVNHRSLSNAQTPIATAAGAPLNFVVSTGDDASHLALSLNYDIGNLQHQAAMSESHFGYAPSSWLKIALTGPGTVFDRSMGEFDIPLPSRTYPATPELLDQRSAATRPVQSGTLCVTISLPSAGSVVNAPSVAVEGQVSGPGKLSDLVVKVGDRQATVNADGSFRATGVSLTPGTNAIVASATARVDGVRQDGTSTIPILSIATLKAAEILDSILRWDYQLAIRTQNDPHDELWIKTMYNVPSPSPNDGRTRLVHSGPLGETRAEELFEAIAKFRSGYPDLEPFLEKLTDAAFPGSAAGTDSNVTEALQQAVILVGDVADAWAGQKRFHTDSNDPRPHWFVIRYPDSTEAGPLRMQVYAFQAEGESDVPHFSEIAVVDSDSRRRFTFDHDDPSRAGKGAPPPPPQLQGTWYLSTYSLQDLSRIPAGLAMTLTWPGLHMLETQSATAAVHLVRNAELVDGRTTNPDFVYTTPAVSFSSPALPSVDADGVGPLRWEGTVAKTIAPVFDAVGEVAGKQSKVIKVAATYEWPAVNAAAVDSARPAPFHNTTAAFMVPSQGITEGESRSYTQHLAQQLAQWRDLVQVPGSPDAILALAITVFATVGGSEVPLVNLRNVRFHLAERWWEKAV